MESIFHVFMEKNTEMKLKKLFAVNFHPWIILSFVANFFTMNSAKILLYALAYLIILLTSYSLFLIHTNTINTLFLYSTL